MAFGVPCLHCRNYEAEHEDPSLLDLQDGQHRTRLLKCPGYKPRAPVEEAIEYIAEMYEGTLSTDSEAEGDDGEAIQAPYFPQHRRLLHNIREHEKGIRRKIRGGGNEHWIPILDGCL